MISEYLRPVEPRPVISIEEVAEALAFTYLAYYNAAAIQPRVTEAYTRAWGLDQIINFPRDSTTPGFKVFLLTIEARKRMVIAIEGTTALSQIMGIIDTYLQGFSTTWPGQCVNLYRNVADSIWTKLMANNTCAAAINDGGYHYTFAGHSLGAAAADLLSYKYQSTYPGRSVRVIKFGSPAVGSSSYVQAANRMVQRRINCYMENDPIHNFPNTSMFSTLAFGGLNAVVGTNMQPEDVCQILSRRNAWGRELPVGMGSSLQAAALLSQLRRGIMDDSNKWWCHLIKSYRLAMMNTLGTSETQIKYRFNYLEHDDENAWQTRWSPGTLTWSFMDALNSPGPADVAVFSAGVARAINEPTGGGIEVTGTWGEDAPVASGGGSGGGNWGVVTRPTQAQPLFRRRVTNTR